MKAESYELKTVLNLERRYIIPTFQRDYEWTRDKQWELLFEDLEAVAVRLEQARRHAGALGQSISKAEKEVAPHFLGAIVLDLLPSSAGSLDLRAVIDGQQRLTTLQLLVRGVLDVLTEIKSPRVSQVSRLIFNPPDVVSNPDDRFKLWPRRRDRKVWRVAMEEDPTTDDGHLYLKARRFFREQTNEIVRAADGSDRSEVVVDALLTLFKLVVIDLEDNDDAQVIFEVLNGRQTPLSATDLVKNLLFLRAELTNEEELEALYEEHWFHFDDPWWRKVIGRGHAARERRDVLLSSWLTTATNTEVNLGHLYGEVRRYLDNADRKIVDILSELSMFSKAFREVFDRPPTLHDRISDAYRRLERLGVTTALPLLIWLKVAAAERVSDDEHLRSVVAVESWVVRRLLVGAQTRGYGKRFVDVMNEAQLALNKGESISEAVERALLVGGLDKLVWPTDTQLMDAFVGRQFYNSLTQERIRMILGAIDVQMHVEHVKGERPTFDYDSLHIEHMLPQSWREQWPVEPTEAAERALAEQERERAKNRIGNLTLITGPLNIPLSNGPWSMKRPALGEHSNLRVNVGPVATETWDESTIEDRGRKLARVAARVWTRPEGREAEQDVETFLPAESENEESEGGANAREELYRGFWTKFLERVRGEHPDWTRSQTPPSKNWYTMKHKGFHVTPAFVSNGRLRQEIYISKRDPERNLRIFRRLEALRDRVESIYGGPLVFEALPTRDAFRVGEYREGNVSNTWEHEEYIDWFIDRGSRLRVVLDQLDDTLLQE